MNKKTELIDPLTRIMDEILRDANLSYNELLPTEKIYLYAWAKQIELKEVDNGMS